MSKPKRQKSEKQKSVQLPQEIVPTTEDRGLESILYRQVRGILEVARGRRARSTRLRTDGAKGFSKNNLWYMRQFYLAFPEKLHALRGELSWAHYRLLLKVEKPGARAWYEAQAAAQNWPMREEWENPAIGILLCADKYEVVVRYTLPEGEDNIFAARYRLQLPSEDELAAELRREQKAVLAKIQKDPEE